MKLTIGLLGFGTVGATTAHYLLHTYNKDKVLPAHTLHLKSIYTRTPQKVKDSGIPSTFLSEDWRHIIQDDEINCVVELIGGIEDAKEMIIAALTAGKHVVTANKALLAHHGIEIIRTAIAHNVCVAFEASCGGGIPIIQAISEGLTANDHSAIYGVMNGTCNFILTEMDKNNLSFDIALKKATDCGLAEADPSLDIDGYDAGHKIAILSSLVFRYAIHMNSIPIMGISNVHNTDIYFGKKFSYTMKLIAAAFLEKDFLSIWVHPAFLTEHHLMKYVDGSFNAISIIGDEVGHTFYYGRGAGGQPTNSAIISDLLSIANGSYLTTFKNIASWITNTTQHGIVQTGIGHLYAPVYVRMQVYDKPGVLAIITHIIGKHNISIARVLQEDALHSPVFNNNTTLHSKFQIAELIIITHSTMFETMYNACKELEALDTVIGNCHLYPIIESPKDHLE